MSYENEDKNQQRGRRNYNEYQDSRLQKRIRYDREEDQNRRRFSNPRHENDRNFYDRNNQPRQYNDRQYQLIQYNDRQYQPRQYNDRQYQPRQYNTRTFDNYRPSYNPPSVYFDQNKRFSNQQRGNFDMGGYDRRMQSHGRRSNKKSKEQLDKELSTYMSSNN